MIPSRVFSFILSFLLLKIQKRFEVESLCFNNLLISRIAQFSSKRFLSLFPENTLKNITTSQFFAYESIKASNFANVVCFNQELNLLCISKRRYRIRKHFSDCYHYFLMVLVLTQDLLMVLSSINMINMPFLNREVFILYALTSTVFYQN